MRRFGGYAACVLLLIAGCGGGGSSSSNSAGPGQVVIQGIAIKGPVSNGTVTAYSVTSAGARGASLGTATTDSNGNYRLTVNYTGPLLVEVTGGNFTDEASSRGTTIPTGAGNGLQAVIANVTAGSTVKALITPLTTLAAARAQAMSGGLTSTNIGAANQQVGTHFGGIDILNTQPINPITANSAVGATQNAINYGLILAGMSQEAQTLNLGNPFNLVTALAADFSDGVFNGYAASTRVSLEGAALNLTAGTTDLGTAITTFSTNAVLNLSGGSVSAALITAIDSPPTAHTLGGTVSGLSGTVVIGNSNGDSLTISNNSSFNFPLAVPAGATYSVSVTTQPAKQTCSVINGSGTVGSANVTNIAVNCVSFAFNIGVTVSNLTGDGLKLQNNGGDDLTISGTGTVTANFSTPLAANAAYDVTILTQPAGQICSVTNGSGTVGTADVDVPVTCAVKTFFTIGVTVSNLTGAGLVLQDNGGDNLPISGNGDFVFSTQLAANSPYDVTVLSQPTTGHLCTVINGSGTVGTADINVTVNCGAIVDVLYSFNASASDGAYPLGGLIQGSDGNFYGVTHGGGSNRGGTVFKVTPAGVETVLYSFGATVTDGQTPYAGLTAGSDGNFYGTTSFGGTNNKGTIFKITPAGEETVLYSFGADAADGSLPTGSLILGADGDFYGTTYAGGASDGGTVFKVTPTGAETVLYSFGTKAADGRAPYAGLTAGNDGNFYGTTVGGGANACGPSVVPGCGTVFKITPAGAETVLYSFGAIAVDGQSPYAGLILGNDGNFYGTTIGGGTNGHGTVFKISPAGGETILYSFGAGAADGQTPYDGLILGNDGNFYGTTYSGGANGRGTVFMVTPAGAETVLYSFGASASDGVLPYDSRLILGNDGNFYGTTYGGGTHASAGTLFRAIP